MAEARRIVDPATYQTVRKLKGQLEHLNETLHALSPSSSPEIDKNLLNSLDSLNKHKDAKSQEDVDALVAGLETLSKVLTTCVSEKNMVAVNTWMDKISLVVLYLLREACVTQKEVATAKRAIFQNKLENNLLNCARCFVEAIVLSEDSAHSSVLFNFALEFMSAFGIFPAPLNGSVWGLYVTVIIPQIGVDMAKLGSEAPPINPILTPLVTRVIQHYMQAFPDDKEKEKELDNFISIVSKDEGQGVFFTLLEILAFGDLLTKKKAFLLLKSTYTDHQFIDKWTWDSYLVEATVLAIIALFQDPALEVNEYGLKMLAAICKHSLPAEDTLQQLLAGALLLLDITPKNARTHSSFMGPIKDSGSVAGTLLKKKAKSEPSPDDSKSVHLMSMHERTALYETLLFPWLIRVRDSNPSIFAQCLSPNPPELAREVWNFRLTYPENTNYKVLESFSRVGLLMLNNVLGESFHKLIPLWFEQLQPHFSL